MDTNGKYVNTKDELLSCDAFKCMILRNGNWEERLEDLIFGVGP
ncbi:MAG: hypothetical protein ABFD97_23780 [Syntrophobacter sp.]